MTGSTPRPPLSRDLSGTPLPASEDGSPAQDPAAVVDALEEQTLTEHGDPLTQGQAPPEQQPDVEPPV